MRSELHWTFGIAGAVGTANGVGYLIGAAIAAPLAHKFGSRAVFVVAAGVSTVGLLGSALSDLLSVIMVLRFIVGIAGAACFVVGGGLTAEAGRRHDRRRATWLLAIYFAGCGFGIVASGIAIPWVLTESSHAIGWRLGWLVLGVVAAACTAVSVRGVLQASEPTRKGTTHNRLPLRPISYLLVSYFLYGTGYISYMTFIVAFLNEQGANATQIAAFWIVLGATSVAATFAWGRLLARSQHGRGSATVLVFVSLGAVIPAISDSPLAMFGSAVLFGGSFLSVVTAVTAVARQTLPAIHWTSAIGALTIAFALGQCVGPALTGAIADSGAGVGVGLSVSAIILFVAALTSLLHRDPVKVPRVE